jgi:hypothetical protein
VLVAAACGVAAASPAEASAATQTFVASQFDSTSPCAQHTGPVAAYTVPADVADVSIVAVGQGGGTGGSTSSHGGGTGGQPGEVTAHVSVMPGQVLYISSAPGAAGRTDVSSHPGGPGAPGGYATFVSLDAACGQSSQFPADPVLVAAGGGGGGTGGEGGPGGTGGNAGGGGGNPGGNNGQTAGGGGFGATSSAGGVGGTAGHGQGFTAGAGAKGGAFGGGLGGRDDNGLPSGGGGGGGYFGGGGGGGQLDSGSSADGGGGGGGGGSDYAEPAATTVVTKLGTVAPSVSFTPDGFFYGTSTTLVSSAPVQSNPSQSIAYTATVTADAGAPLSAQVVFTASDGVSSVNMGSGPLVGGSALISYALPPGRWSVSARYIGDGFEAGSSSDGLLTETVLPAAPVASVTRGGTVAVVSWSEAQFGGAPVTGFNVYEGTSSGGESSTPVNLTPITTDNYPLMGLSPGTTYYFTVVAMTATDSSLASAELSAGPLRASTGVSLSVAPPPAPDVFVADATNKQVVEVPGGGGPQSAPWQGPGASTGVAVDTSGDLFIADSFSQRVVEVPAGGTLTPISSGGYQFGTLGGLAVDRAGDIFVVDVTHSALVVIPPGGVPAFAFLSGLTSPHGVAVDVAGDIFFTEGDRVVEKPRQGPQITIGAGFSGPQGVAVDASGDVFVADTGNGRVVEVPAGQATQRTVATGLSRPVAVSVDAAGDVFVVGATSVELPTGGGAPRTIGQGFSSASGVATGAPAATSTVGAGVTLSATVMSTPLGGAPTGAVTFSSGATRLGAAQLTGGSPDTATLTTSALPVGGNQVTASYGGDANNVGAPDGAPPSSPITVIVDPTQVAGSLAAGGILSLNATPSAGDPVGVSVTTPNAGAVSISSLAPTRAPPTGFALLGRQVQISAPAASVTAPLRLVFTVDQSLLPPGDTQAMVSVFRDGVRIVDCVDASGSANPDPCVASRDTTAGGALRFTVLSSHASTWNFAVANPPVCQAQNVAAALGMAVVVQLQCSDSTQQALSYTIDQPPADGTLTTPSPSGTLSYTPTGGFAGLDSFTYHAASVNGTATTKTVSIAVAGRPTAAISAPADKPAYALNQSASAAYSCSPGPFGGIPKSCSGTVATGAQFDTAHAGTHTFTVIAADTDGLSASVSTKYTVNRGTPTITWPNPAQIAYGTALSPTQLDASATVSGSFTYAPALGAVLDAGPGQTLTATFTPTDAADYNPVSATAVITVVKADQTITFVSPSGVTYGDPDTALAAAASSGLAVGYASTTTSVCTIVGGRLHTVAAGGCTITADQAGGANYNAAPEVQRTFTIAKGPSSTVVSASPAPARFGSPVTFTATVSATPGGLATGTVAFFLDGQTAPVTSTTLQGAGASFTTSGLGAGTHTITARYTGDNNSVGSTSPPAAVTITADRTLTGAQAGAVIVAPGTTLLLRNANVSGALDVKAGGAVELESSTVNGSLTASGPSAVRVCASTVHGAVDISGAGGGVLVGDQLDGCNPNTIGGSLILRNNTHGLQAVGNRVAAALSASGNSGAGPFPDDPTAQVTGNGPNA